MVKVGLLGLTLALSACSATPGTLSPASTLSDSTMPGASVACIDRGQLADSAETVMAALQGVATALAVPNVDQAGSLAATASATMRSVADLASPVRPDAAKDVRNAADELDSATSQFPGGMTAFSQARADWQQALLLAQTGECPA